jgi:hypothetical protein
MRPSLTTAALTIVTLVATATPAATALTPAPPAPPKTATIKLGVGMAGATLGQQTTAVTAAGTIGPAPFSAWGRLNEGFCFEGTACSWTVPGGGDVFIERHSITRRIISIGTSAPGWKTSKGVGSFSTVAKLRSAYNGLVKMKTCTLGGFGAPNSGYRYGKHAFFGTSQGRVTVVYVTRDTIRAGGC